MTRVTYTTPFRAKTHNVTLTLSSARPTRTNYNFLGWATTDTATSAQYQPGGSYTNNASVTLYAVWQAVTPTYTVNYNANGGSGTVPPRQTDNSVKLSGQHGLYRSNYVFAGWNTSSNGSGTAYNTGDEVKSNLTLYAQWKSIRVITYNINSGSGTLHPIQHVIDGDSVKLSAQHGMYRSGYIFAGWNTSSSGSGTKYNAGDVIKPSANLTLYAQWQRI
jgi:uncharacterized repeat protein (TIGR02543 family)